MKADSPLVDERARFTSAWLPINPGTLERLRITVKNHINKYNALAGLNIEPSAPPKGMPFQFIHAVPKLPDIAKDDKTLWYRCSYCERNCQFKEGRIVYCADEKLRLIGKNCWAKHIDKAAWKAANEDFRTYLRRQKFQDLKERYVPAVTALRQELVSCKAQVIGFSDFVDGFAVSFKTQFPELANALERSIKNNCALTIERDILQLNTGNRERRIETIFYFNGEQALIQRQKSIQEMWKKAVDKILDAERHFLHTDWENLSNPQFATQQDVFQSHCRDAIETADRINAKIRAISIFLGSNNVEGIVRWATHNECDLCLVCSGTFETISGGLRYRDRDGSSVETRLPTDLRPLALNTLGALRDLLAK